jgi:hypothetical protein
MKGDKARIVGSLRIGMPVVFLLCSVRLSAASGEEFWDDHFGVPGVEGYGVSALAVWENQLFAGGGFLSAGGVTATNFARWDGSQWSQVGGGVGADLSQGVGALVVQGDRLYVGGYFTNAGTVPVRNIACWDGANWSALGTGIDHGVMALATDGTNLYVGGSFTNVGGIVSTNVVRWDGERWWSMAGGVSGNDLGLGSLGLFGIVEAIAVGPGGVYVAGDITSAGGIKLNNIARWDGTKWFAVREGLPTRIRALAIAGSQVHAGADPFKQGDLAVYVSRWDGAQWQAILTGPWPGAGGAVTLLALGRDVYLGGGLVFPGGFPIPGVAKWDGSQWWPLGSALSAGAVRTLASTGAELFVGGYFASVGGKPATNIALWHLSHALEINGGTDQVSLSWPATGSNLVLESASSLPATNWTEVPEPPAVVDDQLVVTNRTTEARQFYRLRRE